MRLGAAGHQIVLVDDDHRRELALLILLDHRNMIQRQLHAGNDVVLGRLQRDQDDVGTVEASEQVFVGRALDINEDDFALLASRHESGESVRLLRTYPEFRLV